MENQQPNLEHNGQIPDGDKRQDDVMFYNVMPRVKSTETMVEPTLELAKTEQGTGTEEKAGFAGWLKNHKLYVVTGLVVIIGGPAVYFGVNYFFNKPQEENLLVKNTGNNLPKPENSNTAATGTSFTIPQEWLAKYFARLLRCKKTK